MRICNLIVVLSVFAGLAGCSESGPRKDPREEALKDPMNYNPAAREKYDVSGGGLMELDRNALRKDLRNVLDP